MPRYALPLLVTLPLFLVASIPPGAHAAATSDPGAAVDALFARWRGEETPGCAVAVAQDGKTVLERAYGMADLEHGVPNTPETVFEAGSVSKQFTAAAVVLLALEGKLALDDAVRKYVPEVPDYGAPITLRQMLHHTSGLRDWGSIVAVGGWPRGSRAHTHAHVLDVVGRQKALNHPPGAEFIYSNSNYNLLAIVVERVSGRPFAEFTRERIFQPLGMTRTEWRNDYTRVVKGRAIAYDRRQDGYHSDMPFENVHGNGGLLTTLRDLLAWNDNFVHARVGGRKFVEELEARGRLSSGREMGYAKGLFVDTYQGTRQVSHSGATAGYRAFLARYPQKRLSIALLCNAGDADTPTLVHQIADLYLGASRPPPAPPSPVALPERELASKAGLYRDPRTRETWRLSFRDGKLESEQGVLMPLSRTLFQLGSSLVRVAFDGEHDGRPLGLRFLAPDGTVVSYVPVAETQPTAAELGAYAGAYVSDEAEVTYQVAVEEGQLVMRRRPDARYVLVPEDTDAFRIPGLASVVFHRAPDGRVEALSLGLSRVRDLRLQHVGR